MTDYKFILDCYWPVIESAIEVHQHYLGKNKHKKPLICPDVTGEMITKLIEARKACPVERTVVDEVA